MEKKESYKKPSRVGKAIIGAAKKVGLVDKNSWTGDVYLRKSPGKKMTAEKAAKVKAKNPGLEKKSVLDKKYPLNSPAKTSAPAKKAPAKKAPAPVKKTK